MYYVCDVLFFVVGGSETGDISRDHVTEDKFLLNSSFSEK
jgi:hypothetical protein